MPNLLERERIKYEAMWEVESYNLESPGERYLPLFIDMAKPKQQDVVLDAGCGAGKGMDALRSAGLKAYGYDLTVDPKDPYKYAGCLWHDLCEVFHGTFRVNKIEGYRPEPFDWVYCTDVLEHIPTAFTMLVVARLLKIAMNGAFFSISFQPDQMGVWIGETLHETVQPYLWWRDNLAEVGEIIESRDLLGKGVFLLKGASC
jgi:2-polyprenyl-3-methyl-5-hydroxy-6-metoxy-1,4-benzoquinol methylase